MTAALEAGRTFEARSWYGDWWRESSYEPAPTSTSAAAKSAAALTELQTSLLHEAEPPRWPTGLVLGRFLPPHRGHQFLVDFARAWTEQLTLVLCSNPADPILPETRLGWLRELFPEARLLHEPDSARRDWAAWEAVLRRLMPKGVSCLFASEPGAQALADRLGAAFVCVDPERRFVPISGTRLRERPMLYWEFFPACVRPHFVRRAVLLGAEGTGKSTLARRLAERFGTAWTDEFSRRVALERRGLIRPEDLGRIARGQASLETAAARQANRLLIADTDLLTLQLWSTRLFGDCPPWLLRQARERLADLYLLSELEEPLTGQRSADRTRLEMSLVASLKALSRPYVVLRGSWDERFEQASAALEGLLKDEPPSAGPAASAPG